VGPKISAVFAAAAIIVGGIAVAEAAGVNNTLEVGLSEKERDLAKDRGNPLPAPDVSHAMAETGPMTLAAGVHHSRAGGAVPASGPTPFEFGSFGIPYTSTRVGTGATVVDKAGPSFLSETYPYRASGKLTYKISSDSFSCSATLVLRSVLVTAAHCVMDFGSNKRFTNWQFTPGAYQAQDGTERSPYGTWTWAHVEFPPTWANGTDPGSGSARNNDVAVIILQPDKDGKFIGDTVGVIDYAWNNYSFVQSARTGNLLTAAVTTLGYPGLFDDGDIMQRTDGPTYTTMVSEAFQLWQGSNLTGGASGGPWIVNFRPKTPVYSGGAGQGSEPDMAIIGVTSWGSANPNKPKDNYSSQFRQNPQFPKAAYGNYGAGNIGGLVYGACTSVAKNGKTFEKLGYCD
jgi:hypothetical protein